MQVTIRRTKTKEHFQTEHVTREAFWKVDNPGCNEHLILNQLRKSDSYIQELDIVAVCEEQIIGHIISTKAKVIDSMNHEKEILCVGPFSVLPDYQKKGIGAKLMDLSISQAQKMGYKGMLLFGNPGYYYRFRFRNAIEYHITTKDFQNFEAFMGRELQVNGLDEVHGRFFEDNAFSVNQEVLNDFEKQFPFKEKRKPDTQLH
jgi:predicted N-acetyltransferase YhbS